MDNRNTFAEFSNMYRSVVIDLSLIHFGFQFLCEF